MEEPRCIPSQNHNIFMSLETWMKVSLSWASGAFVTIVVMFAPFATIKSYPWIKPNMSAKPKQNSLQESLRRFGHMLAIREQQGDESEEYQIKKAQHAKMLNMLYYQKPKWCKSLMVRHFGAWPPRRLSAWYSVTYVMNFLHFRSLFPCVKLKTTLVLYHEH